MITEEYVTFETAKLLRKAGFPQECGYDSFFDCDNERYSIPTQAQAMRWLRDEKNLFVEISYDPGFARPPYYVEIQTLPEGGFIYDTSYPMAHATYESAAEAGIQAACKYIISKQ